MLDCHDPTFCNENSAQNLLVLDELSISMKKFKCKNGVNNKRDIVAQRVAK